MNHVIMANHMISLITSSTTDPWYRHKYKSIGCGFIAFVFVILLIVYASWFCVLVFRYLFACLFSSWSCIVYALYGFILYRR